MSATVTLAAVAQAVADSLADVRDVLGLQQVEPRLITNPTPPCIDIYPADPFQDNLGFGLEGQLFWTVRARVSTSDQDGGQDLLLSMLERDGATSIRAALAADPSFGGSVDSSDVQAVSGFIQYVDPGAAGSLLGAEWRLTVLTGGA